MARAYGSSAHLLMKRETVYGQAGTGNLRMRPFNRCNLASEQPLQDVINDEGDIVVPVDPRYLGLWLTGCSAIRIRPTTSMGAGIMSSRQAATACRATH
jgi:hypothetical protein